MQPAAPFSSNATLLESSSTTTPWWNGWLPHTNSTNPGWHYPDGEIAGGIADVVLIASLSGLTGIRATIPIFVVALGSKLWGPGTGGVCFSNEFCPGWEFPLQLDADYEWIQRPKTLWFIGFMILLELLSDCIPIVAEAVDSVMIVLKPVLAVFMANGVDFDTVGGQMAAIVSSAAASAPVALAKMSTDITIDGVTAGTGTVFRSFTEDVIVFTMTPLTLLAPGVVFCVIVCCTGCCCWCMWSLIKSRFKRLLAKFRSIGNRKSQFKMELLELESRLIRVEQALNLPKTPKGVDGILLDEAFGFREFGVQPVNDATTHLLAKR